MKVIYSGKTKDFTPEVEKKVEAKLAKLGKMIEHRGEKCAQVLHKQERHLHTVEIITNFYDHQLAAKAAEPDLLTAICEAFDRLDKQIVKLRTRWRDTHRDPKGMRAQKEDGVVEKKAPIASTPQPKKASKANGSLPRPKVFRVIPDGDAKPMTLEEAMLVLPKNEDYLVYRDLDRKGLSVLMRRKDGNLDLIEA